MYACRRERSLRTRQHPPSASHVSHPPTHPPILLVLSFQTAAEGDNKYGRENYNYPILGTYAEGGILEVKMVVSTYHWVR